MALGTYLNGQISLNQGVVGRYCLDGDAFDDSPNGNFGANFGATSDTNRNNRLGASMHFNGSNQYIQIPNKGIYNSLFTYAFWFYCTDYPDLNEASVMLAVGGNTADQAVMLANNLENQYTGLLVKSSYTLNHHYNIYAPGLPEKNRWHHVLVSRNSDSIRLYLNGVKVTALRTYVAPQYQGTPAGARIGARSNGSHFYTGKIDDVWMYNRALTHQESIALFNYKGEFGINPGMRDTAICGNGSVVLDCNVENASYSWSTGAKTKAISVRDTGTYWVIIEKNCSWVSDTFRVGRRGFVSIPESIDLCTGDTAEIKLLTFEGQGWEWYDGSSDSSIKVSSPGKYWVVAREDHCRFYDSTTVNIITHPEPLGKDTTYCDFDQLTLKPYPPINSPVWNDLSNLDSLQINQSGTYWLSFSYRNCPFVDTIQINLIADDLFLGNDTLLCAGQTVTLEAYQPHYSQYEWSTGSNQSQITINDSGSYWVSVTQDICHFGDSLRVEILHPTPVLGTDTSFCQGDSAHLQVYLSGAHQFHWNTGDTLPYLFTSREGMHWVDYTYQTCRFSDTLLVKQIANPIKLPTDTAFCGTDPITIHASHPDIDSYEWSTGENTPSLTIDSSGFFVLRAEVNFCVFYHSLRAKGALEKFDFGADLFICPDQVLQLDAGPAFAQSYVWNNGSTAADIQVNTAGWYWVDYELEGCTYRDSIRLHEVPNTLDLGPNQDLCEGDTLVLSAENTGADSYRWNTGATTGSITVLTGGDYRVEAQFNGGCTFLDSISIQAHALPSFHLGEDTLLCENDMLILSPGDYSSYLWHDGSTSKTLQTKGSGSYWVKVEDEWGCMGWDSIQIKTESLPVYDDWPDTLLCMGQALRINSQIEGTVYSYLWHDGIQDSVRSILDSGYYTVEIEHLCGTFVRNILVDFEDCESLYLPNSFTPNGDRINDEYSVFINKPKEFHLAIYTRWGQQVFETSDINESWDGSFEGEALPSGIYLGHVSGVNVMGEFFSESVLIHLVR